jgi:Fic family protein/DNA-binding XRE family transcriptional regulator
MVLANYIANWRDEQDLSLIELAQRAGIDKALLSKYEKGKRLPSKKHIRSLSDAMNISVSELKKHFLVDKITSLLQNEPDPLKVLLAAEDHMEYLVSEKALALPELSPSILQKLDEVDKLHQQWNEAKPLTGSALKKMEEYFSTKYTYESNQIEGNTLTYKETHLVVSEGMTIGGKSLADHLEAINHTEAIYWLKNLVNGNEDLTKRNLLDLHRLVLKSIDTENAGVYRNVRVRIGGSAHVPPEPLLLNDLMDDYFMHYERQKRVLHPVILAAEMHERLVSIHPFVDGNGRTARLVMNFVLLKNGYTISSLKGDYDARMEYYNALENVQINNNPEPFYHLIIDKVKESLEEHLKMVK